jgi:hypothetical protein
MNAETAEIAEHSCFSADSASFAFNGLTMKPEDHSRRQQELAGWPVTIETYKLGDVYHCTIANVDPGARFARADGATKEEAEALAIDRATRFLAQTRRFPTGA